MNIVVRQVGERFEDLVARHMRDFIADAGYAHLSDPLEAVRESVVGRNYIPWHLLHYYDIPDRPTLLTQEEVGIMNMLYTLYD